MRQGQQHLPAAVRIHDLQAVRDRPVVRMREGREQRRIAREGHIGGVLPGAVARRDIEGGVHDHAVMHDVGRLLAALVEIEPDLGVIDRLAAEGRVVHLESDRAAVGHQGAGVGGHDRGFRAHRIAADGRTRAVG